MKVFELMKTHVVKTTPEATLRDAVDMMDLYQVSGLPVVNDRDELVGVVSEYDVIQALLPSYVQLGDGGGAAPNADLATLIARVRDTPVAQAMSSPAVAVDENTDVLEAAAIMLQRRFKRLPVTSEGRLVGVISRIDICQAVLEGQF
ncbi:MAG: CBS domain-containing protein [Chthonomonadales bacterium]